MDGGGFMPEEDVEGEAALAELENGLAIDIRGKDEPVALVPLPFYKRKK